MARGVLHSGFSATAGWVLWTSRRALHNGRAPLRAIPVDTIITTPIRSMWADDTVPAAPGLRRLLPVLLSTAFAATLVLLFMQYLAAIVLVPASRSENQVHTPAP